MPRTAKSRPGPEPASSEPVYQLKISLKAIEPPIWRRVQIRGGTLLPRLHAVIQKAMGWQNDEPHYEVEAERNLSLREVAPLVGMRFEYVYDLGDGWLHDVLVERIDMPTEPLRSPICLGGERACPPEDCGGFPGYEELLEILRDPDHPEHEDRLDWVGGTFDPEAFDLPGVNRKLGRLR